MHYTGQDIYTLATGRTLYNIYITVTHQSGLNKRLIPRDQLSYLH
jgi:hypothetical protein